MTYFLNLVLENLFPSNCLSCSQPPNLLCADCHKKMEKSAKIVNLQNESIVYFYNYREELVTDLVWQTKFHHDHSALEVLTQPLSAYITTHFSGRPLYLIPVPISQLDKRLHNHAEITCKKILANMSSSSSKQVGILNILKKNTTNHQALTKSTTERQENIKGNINLDQRALKHLHPEAGAQPTILLIDDVATTGSTLLECKKVLEGEGLHVSGLITLCH